MMPLFLLFVASSLGYLTYACFPYGLIFLHSAIAALALASLYIFNKPALLGKKPDGTFSILPWLFFSPFLIFRILVLKAQMLLFPEAPCQEVAKDIWIARRLNEIPAYLPLDILIVDLTSEFVEPLRMRLHKNWHSIPILDAYIPNKDALAKIHALTTIPQPILIHCAQGRGRSATLAAWLMVAWGKAKNVDEALTQIQSVRPHAKVKRVQRRWLERECNKEPQA